MRTLDSADSLRVPPRRQLMRAGMCMALVVALPLAAQARMALPTAINRIARNRALSQRIAKAYAQQQLGVSPGRARDVLDTARSLVRTGFDETMSQPWPGEVTTLLAALRAQFEQLEILVQQDPTHERVLQVSTQADRMLHAADLATTALEKLAQKKSVRLLNLAGRQRMLSQRLAKNYCLQAMAGEHKVAAELLAADAREFESALDELSKAPLSTPAIRAQLELAQNQWVFFAAAIKHNPDTRGLDVVATTSERLLEVMNHLTDLYEAALKEVLG